MNFTFDGDIAKEYGIAEAILFYNIAFWEKQNRLNNNNCFEGKYWTYNTLKAYAGLFYFISEATIKRALKHLKDEGLILAGNFDDDRFNHTNYYTVSDKGFELLQNCTIRLGQNDLIEKVNLTNSILNKNTDSSDINNTDINIPPIIPREVAELDEMFNQFWASYPKKVDKKGCEKKFKKIKNLKAIFPDIMSALENQKNSKQWNEKNGEYIPHPSTWINQERWNNVNEVADRQAAIDEIASEHFNDFLL